MEVHVSWGIAGRRRWVVRREEWRVRLWTLLRRMAFLGGLEGSVLVLSFLEVVGWVWRVSIRRRKIVRSVVVAVVVRKGRRRSAMAEGTVLMRGWVVCFVFEIKN